MSSLEKIVTSSTSIVPPSKSARATRDCDPKWFQPLPANRKSQTTGLGDLAAEFFASLGITNDRYLAAKEAIGFDPTCGCDGRRQWLNRVGESLGINGAATKLTKWMTR